MKITRTWARAVVSLATMLFRLWKLFHAVHALGRQASWEETTLVTNLCWHGNNENLACKHVRFHSILDGSSLAHAIQVLMGPLLMNYGRMRCTEIKTLRNRAGHTHTHTHTWKVKGHTLSYHQPKKWLDKLSSWCQVVENWETKHIKLAVVARYSSLESNNMSVFFS